MSLLIQNLSYAYPGSARKVISDFNMELKGGGIYGLLGANGSGKSTLLYLIAGLLKGQQGEVIYNGVATWKQLPSTLIDIFLVPEEIVLPSVELSEFVRLNSPFYPKFSYLQMVNYLECFRLTPDIHLGQLSMGQKKKAFIAFALACNSNLLIMDEPTNGIDIPGKNEFRRAIVQAISDDRTIIISTHQVRDLDRILDHVMIIDSDGVRLNVSINELQSKYRFIFTTDPSELQGALWVQNAAGGFNAILPYSANAPETDVNLETLFEYTFNIK